MWNDNFFVGNLLKNSGREGVTSSGAGLVKAIGIYFIPAAHQSCRSLVNFHRFFTFSSSVVRGICYDLSHIIQ